MQPDQFLPVMTDSGFCALVSTGLHGNFAVKDAFTGDLYFNPLAMGQSFFQVVEQDVFSAPTKWRQVQDKALAKRLIEAKYGYVTRYFR
jgi:hypothetical protein